MTGPIIEVQGLSRVFQIRDKDAPQTSWFSKAKTKPLTAVGDLCFSIEAGQKVAFIGPNGAGKSTTLRMLSGLLRPSSGTARVCDLIPWDQTRQLASRIGLVFGQRSQLWPALPVEDSFNLLAKIYDLPSETYAKQRDKLVEIFGLRKLLPQMARTLSLGQRMRCDIAAALLHQPQVLFLDEPTIGLDVTAKALLRDHLNMLAREMETTLLLTSHDTDDIEKICHRVILIDRGQKLLDTTLPELQKDYTRFKILRLVTEEEMPHFEHAGVMVEEQGDYKLVLKVDMQEVAVEKIVSLCLEKFKLSDIGIEGLPLEEIIKAIYARKKHSVFGIQHSGGAG